MPFGNCVAQQRLPVSFIPCIPFVILMSNKWAPDVFLNPSCCLHHLRLAGLGSDCTVSPVDCAKGPLFSFCLWFPKAIFTVEWNLRNCLQCFSSRSFDCQGGTKKGGLALFTFLYCSNQWGCVDVYFGIGNTHKDIFLEGRDASSSGVLKFQICTVPWVARKHIHSLSTWNVMSVVKGCAMSAKCRLDF